ncbi:MAG: GH3 auxin-responsive promoter family protein [Eubacteriales bacterium]|nr:GH3 auxin-responsive promoter family protein [Eubacteriales bacterium]
MTTELAREEARSAEAEIRGKMSAADRWNEKNLKTLLEDNKDTEFGKKYDFASIRTQEEYRERVPLSGYEEFRPWIERMVAGEEMVLTAYPLAGLCLTSGTEGRSKYIPVSRRALERYSDQIEWYKNSAYRQAGGKRFLVSGFRVGLWEEKKEYLLSELYYQSLFRSGSLSFAEYAGGKEALFVPGCRDMLYVKAWTALAEENITVIESIFLYEQLLFFRYLQKNWRELLEHMAAGRIPESVEITEEQKRHLLSLPVREERLAHIAEECGKGFDGIAQRLWKGLVLSSGISAASFALEDREVHGYLGRIPLYYFAYVASECHMGVAMRAEDCRYAMLPGSAFYEYLPWKPEEEENGSLGAQTLLPGQVKPGELYEVVLTNFSGLYRYRLGDVVRVTGFVGESPEVEFVLRKNQLLNVAGEKLSILQAEGAVRMLEREHGLPIRRYCIAELAWDFPASYGAVFELERPDADPKQVGRWLDEALGRQNLDYRDIRQLGFLAEPRVLLLDEESYAAFLSGAGMTGGHGKPKHMTGAFPEELWKKEERQR